MKLSSLISFSVLSTSISPAHSICRGEWNTINLQDGWYQYWFCNDDHFVSPVRFVWKTSGMQDDDEYKVELRQADQRHWISAELDNDAEQFSVALGNNRRAHYETRFHCKNEWENCYGGQFSFAIVQCGCPSDRPLMVRNCQYRSYASASDALCTKRRGLLRGNHNDTNNNNNTMTNDLIDGEEQVGSVTNSSAPVDEESDLVQVGTHVEEYQDNGLYFEMGTKLEESGSD